MPTETWREFTVLKIEEETTLFNVFNFYLDRPVKLGLENTKKIKVAKKHLQFVDFDLLTKKFKSFKIEINIGNALKAIDFKRNFSNNEIRRPILETLKEELEVANEKIQHLELELEGEREAAQEYPKAQLRTLRNNIFPLTFAEVERGKKPEEIEKLQIESYIRYLINKTRRLTNQLASRPTRANYRSLERIKQELEQEITELTAELDVRPDITQQEHQDLVNIKTYFTHQSAQEKKTITDLQSITRNYQTIFQQKDDKISVLENDLGQQKKQDQKIAELKQELNTKKSDYSSLNDLYQQAKGDNKLIIENSQKQEQKIKKQKKSIQKLRQAQKEWQKREQELLTEIELLKNPPLTSVNKENIKQKTIVKEVIKEIIIKNIEDKELGFNLSSQEKTELNNLPLREVENYQQQLIKNKFNNLENQIKELSDNKRERERERETKILLLWLLIGLLALIALNFVVKKIKRSKRLSKIR